ncbi:MAG: SGNH/GDSL hydrolase family protein [Clostridia bacterium]|nr:SGNH/GDSL hydrolase family protein [Clostridia bacterium]
MTNAVVFFLFGQSNAVGHGIPMKEEDKIITPLKNVFGLSREKNQSFDIDKLTWSGYKSAGMNLGETQDDTYSIANCLAQKWQNAIDEGKNLPDLYIVQIAIGAQGVTKEYLWYPYLEKKLVPGPLGIADISLHPLAKHIMSLIPESMKKMDKNPRYLMHWRGGENDYLVSKEELKKVLCPIYDKLFSDWEEAVGEEITMYLHRLICEDAPRCYDNYSEIMESYYYINSVFEKYAEKSNISVFDSRNCPDYSKDKEHFGVFLEDDVHFTPEVNKWIADEIIKGQV